MAIAMRGRAIELVLINRNRARARGVATDIRYGLALTGVTAISDADYADLAGASAVVVTAGINEKAGGATDRADPKGRLRLLGANVPVYQDIVPRIVAAAPDAVVIVATDPPEPLAEVARRLSPQARVISTGTYLDSLRFRVHLAQRLGVSASFVDAYVVGEHGTSSVFVWSSAAVGGRSVESVASNRGIAFAQFRDAIEQEVRYANISIIEGTGASQYGIGMVNARIAEAVARDERAVFPVGAYSARYGVTLSLPSVVGRTGVVDAWTPAMSSEETRALEHSARVIQEAVAENLQ
jgi:L-lactate dehydrogenase